MSIENQSTEQTQTPVTEPVVELSRAEKLEAEIAKLRERIAADTAKFNEKCALLASLELLASVDGGSVIDAKVGRADTAKTVQATVVGVQTLEDGSRKFKIFFGQGFDSETVVISESQIVKVYQQS